MVVFPTYLVSTAPRIIHLGSHSRAPLNTSLTITAVAYTIYFTFAFEEIKWYRFKTDNRSLSSIGRIDAAYAKELTKEKKAG